MMESRFINLPFLVNSPSQWRGGLFAFPYFIGVVAIFNVLEKLKYSSIIMYFTPGLHHFT